MSTVNMLHEEDPKAKLLKQVGDVSHITVTGNQVLVATYIRPERTRGNIILPGSTLAEDRYQGKVGLVIAKGPIAFVNDAQNDFGGIDASLGDWIGYRMADGFQLTLKGQPSKDNPTGEYHCRMLHDVDVKLILSSPDDII